MDSGLAGCQIIEYVPIFYCQKYLVSGAFAPVCL